MIQRIYNNIITQTGELIAETAELKSTQPSGYDTSQIYMFTTGAAYDEAIVMTPISRIRRLATFTPVLRDWQPGHYTQIYVQLFQDTVANPYEGMANGGLYMLVPSEYTKDGVYNLQFDVTNADAVSSHTALLKYYVITTAMGGNLSA